MLRTLVAVLALPLVPGGELLLLPAGEFTAPDGALEGEGPWRLGDEQGAALAQRLREAGRDLVIDYEHQTLLAAKNGHPAPAAGWVIGRSVGWVPARGLVAEDVRWSERAAAMIAAGEYRFLSPVFRYDAQTGVPTALLHVALTNTPALTSLPEVRLAAASRFHIHEDHPMPLAALRSLLALADDADEAAVTEAVTALKTKAGEVAALTEQLAALRAGSAPDPAQWVPVAVHHEALAALRGLQSQSASGELAALIERGLAQGQIPGAATAEWLRAQGLAATRAYLDGAPAIAALIRGTQTGGRSPDADPQTPELADEELAVLAQMGVDREAYLKTRATLFPTLEAAR